jgi:hypothetical protein
MMFGIEWRTRSKRRSPNAHIDRAEKGLGRWRDSGPMRFIGGAAIAANRTAPSRRTASVSRTICASPRFDPRVSSIPDGLRTRGRSLGGRPAPAASPLEEVSPACGTLLAGRAGHVAITIRRAWRDFRSTGPGSRPGPTRDR